MVTYYNITMSYELLLDIKKNILCQFTHIILATIIHTAITVPNLKGKINVYKIRCDAAHHHLQ